jgi:hypothetical protein
MWQASQAIANMLLPLRNNARLLKGLNSSLVVLKNSLATLTQEQTPSGRPYATICKELCSQVMFGAVISAKLFAQALEVTSSAEKLQGWTKSDVTAQLSNEVYALNMSVPKMLNAARDAMATTSDEDAKRT